MGTGAELIPDKRGLRLDRVVLLGRTFDEYRRYFLLEPEELAGKTVLDPSKAVRSILLWSPTSSSLTRTT